MFKDIRRGRIPEENDSESQPPTKKQKALWEVRRQSYETQQNPDESNLGDAAIAARKAGATIQEVKEMSIQGNKDARIVQSIRKK